MTNKQFFLQNSISIQFLFRFARDYSQLLIPIVNFVLGLDPIPWSLLLETCVMPWIQNDPALISSYGIIVKKCQLLLSQSPPPNKRGSQGIVIEEILRIASNLFGSAQDRKKKVHQFNGKLQHEILEEFYQSLALLKDTFNKLPS